MSILGAAVKIAGPSIGSAIMKKVAPDLLDGLRGKNKALDVVTDVVEVAATSILELPQDATETDVEKALAENPDAYVRLRQVAQEQAAAELQHAQRMAEIGAEDRASARQMHTVTQDPTVKWLAFASHIFAGFVFIAVCAVIVFKPDAPSALVAIMSAIVGHAFADKQQVSGFYFGDSEQGRRRADADLVKRKL